MHYVQWPGGSSVVILGMTLWVTRVVFDGLHCPPVGTGDVLVYHCTMVVSDIADLQWLKKLFQCLLISI